MSLTLTLTWPLLKKEIRNTLAHPMIYVLSGLFCLIVGWLFFNYLVLAKEATKLSLTYSVLRPIFGNMNFIFLFLAPLITMGAFAEEKKQHTLDLLLQSKLTFGQIILAKFLSSLFIVLFMLSLTLIFPIILAMADYSDWGTVGASYLGIIFSIMCYLSVGLFTSALTENQIIAALLAFCLLLSSMLLVLSASATQNYMLGQIFQYLSVPFHYEVFSRGAIKNYNIVYFASFIFFFSYLTQQSLGARKW